MRPGTQGFVGDRLREAREVRGLTAVALSELANVTPQSISQYEHNRSTPGPDVLEAIAQATKFPVHFFTLPEREVAHSAIFFRSMASATKGARKRAERRFLWLRDMTEYLSEYVEFPTANFPDLRLSDDPLLLTDDEIELAADSVRRWWDMDDGPISNVVSLLEHQGAVVARDQLGAETLDSLSEYVPGDSRPYVMIGTDKGSAARWRFDAAHELGHIILHRHLDPTRLRKAAEFKRIEQQAHRFAAAFLLPLESFGDDLVGLNLDAMMAMKPKWKVSIAMMLQRCNDAGFLSEDSRRRFWINYNRRGWRRSEPFDDVLEVEEPRLLRRAIELIVAERARSGADIAAHLGLSTMDIETLAGLPRGFLGDYAPVSLRDSLTAERFMAHSKSVLALGDPTRTPAPVIQLPLRPQN